MKRILLTMATVILIMTGPCLAAETRQQPAPSGNLTQDAATNRLQIQQQLQQQMQPMIQQQMLQQMQAQMQAGVMPGAAAPQAGLAPFQYQPGGAQMTGPMMPYMTNQPMMPYPAMQRYGMPFIPMAAPMAPAFMGFAPGPQMGMGPVVGRLPALGAGFGPISGKGMSMGMGMGYGPGSGLEMPDNVQKFLDATVNVRRELHAKRFDYFEATRDRNTAPEIITRIEKEMIDLQVKLFQAATGIK